MDPEVGAVNGDERLAELVERGLGGASGVFLGQHDPHRPLVFEDDLAVDDLVLSPAEAVGSEGVVLTMPSSGSSAISTSAIMLLVVGSQPRKLDPGRLADNASSSVAPDQVLSSQGLVTGRVDVDAGVVLLEPGHIAAAVDRYLVLVDPAGEYALDVALP